MTEYVGRVIEFLDAGALKLALVARETKNKLQVTDQNGRQRTVAPKNVVVTHACSLDPARFAAEAEELHRAIEAVCADVDTELLWESVRDESRELQLPDLAGRYFGDAGSTEESGLYRAVFADPVRFRVRGRTVHVRSADEVEARIRTLEKRREREAYRNQAFAWMKSVLHPAEDELGDEPCGIPDELEGLVRRVEAMLRKEPVGKADELREWLGRCGANRDPYDAAFDLLRRTGRIARDSDCFLVMAGIFAEFPEAVIAAAEALAPYQAEPGREDFSDLVCFSIDDEDTREVDDALTVERKGDRLRVGVHIADVARFVERGGALDAEAMRRGATIYLPNCSVTMLPRSLSCDLASLNRGELRATMSFVAEVDADGTIVESSLARGQVRVSDRLTYDEADALIERGSEDELSSALAELDRVTARLTAEREARGALTIRRPELRVRVRDGVTNLQVLEGRSVSQRIVSEMMIWANGLAASTAFRDDVPIIYRTQDPPTEPIEPPTEYDPVRLDGLFRCLRRSELSTHAGKHSGLGLEAYTQMTSPIRRLSDLVLQRQLLAHLTGDELPYTREQLFEVLATAQAIEQEAREVEGKSTRYWVLEHLAALGDEATFEVTVVRDLGPKLLVETNDLYIRGTMSAGGEQPGDVVPVRIERLDSERDMLTFCTV